MKKKLNILYEDKELLIIDKPAKILTVSSEKENYNTLYRRVSEYVKKQNSHNKIFIVNRLDKDTSGIVVFAKNKNVKELYQNNWQEFTENKEYLAIVQGIVKPNKGKLVNYLKENKQLKVYVAKEGKLAITNYEVLGKNKNYTLLKILIETGRKNQIRVQLANINHPIVGDKKYNALKNPIGRLGLHATYMFLKSKNLAIVSKVPKEFKYLFPKEIAKYEQEMLER